MSRSKILSALALTGLLGAVAVAQQPAKNETPTTVMLDKSVAVAQVVLDAKTDPVAEAVRNHPDVRVAEAKLRVAEAELAQAKLLVAQRVTVAQAKLDDARIRAEHAAKKLQRIELLRKQGGVPAEVVDAHTTELAQARAAVVAAEAELRTAQGVAPAAKGIASFVEPTTVTLDAGGVLLRELKSEDSKQIVLALDSLAAAKAPPGSAADKLRGLIDKPVKLGEQKGKLTDLLAALRSAAGEPDLVIRVPPWPSIQDTQLTIPEGERSFVAWVDLVFDEFASHVAQHSRVRSTLYVREYGLMMASPDTAPPGAITLGELARQVRAEKAARANEPGAPKK